MYSSGWVERLARARLIYWGDMNAAQRAAVEPEWQQGFGRFPSGSNPYQIDRDTWQWAAFEMGWQEADRLNR